MMRVSVCVLVATLVATTIDHSYCLLAPGLPLRTPTSTSKISFTRSIPWVSTTITTTTTRKTQSSNNNGLFQVASTTEPDILDIETDTEVPAGVVCARGVCVLADEDTAEELCYLEEDEEGNLTGMTCVTNTNQAKEKLGIFSFDYLWPRALLLGCSVLYGTNFPLGRIMNEALPASATTSGRMLLASVSLLPFLFQLDPELRKTAVVGGSFCALGYFFNTMFYEQYVLIIYTFLWSMQWLKYLLTCY